jgi:hypothetical protein
MHPDKWIEPLLRLRDRSVPLLIALALICAIAFGILAVCWFFVIEDAASAFRAYGHWFAIGAVMFGILAGARIIEQRRSKTVHLIAEEQQSFWGQSRQPDGRITTQFAFRLRASNLTDKPIRLLDLRLLRPPVRSSDQGIAVNVRP